MSSSLSTCSLDVQCAVFEHTPLLCLGYLLLTGCKRLTRAIFSVAKIHHSAFNGGPLRVPRLSQFPNLCSFAASYPYLSHLVEIPPLFSWKELPKTLVQIHLDFLNSISVIQGTMPSSIIDLNVALPNLQDLRVQSKSIDMETFSNLVEALPRNLQSLSLKCRSSPEISFPRNLIWPPEMTYLCLEVILLDISAEEGLQLPTTLTSLSVRTECVREVQLHLPELLTELNVWSPLSAVISTDTWPKLPRELVRFESTSCTCTASDVAHLPRGITHLSILSKTLLEPQIAAQLPPRLKHLSFNMGSSFPDLETLVETLSLLPRSLTSFPLFTPSPYRHIIKALPPLIQQLRFDRNMSTKDNNNCIPFLPKFLTSLALQHLDDHLAPILPRTVTTLLYNTGQLGPDGVRALPPNLAHLISWSGGLKDDESVSLLPPFLLSLNWGIRDPKIVSAARWDITDKVFSFLPRNLTSLTISIDPQYLTNDWLIPIKELTSLITLRIGGAQSQVLTSSHLLLLPPSLRELATTISGVLHEDHLWQLPKYLIKLSIRGSNGSFCGITNQGVQKLPRTLIWLDLPACLYLTAWCLSDLPPYLQTFITNDMFPEFWLRRPQRGRS